MNNMKLAKYGNVGLRETRAPAIAGEACVIILL